MKKIILVVVLMVVMILAGVTSNAQSLDYQISYDMVTVENGSSMNVVYTINNSESELKSAVLFVILYEDGKLVRCRKTETTVLPNETKTENAVLPLEGSGNVYTVKVMAFENLEVLKPLGTCKFIKDVEPYSRQKHLYLNAVSGKEINIYMNSLQTIGNNEKAIHTIIYNPLSLLPLDLCGFTYEKEVFSGEIKNTGIVINKADFENGILEFSFKTPDGRNTGINNIIKFKALTDLTQESVIYTIQEVN